MRALALAVVSRHMEGGQERWVFKRNTIAIWLVVLTILKNMEVNGKAYPINYGK
jgi:hypothetical protein